VVEAELPGQTDTAFPGTLPPLVRSAEALMKRVGIVALVVALALGGCVHPPPAGTDGDLTNGWPAMPAAQVVVPAVGACYSEVSSIGYLPLVTAAQVGKSLDCGSTDHEMETAYVGTFTGDVAAASAPPADDSPAFRSTYVDCEVNASQYLGGYWWAAQVWVSVVLPDADSWHVGARWFRCDVGHMASPLRYLGIIHTGSVKDGLRGSRPLAITCLTAEETSTRSVYRTDPADCNAPHQAEFVGIYVAPVGPWPVADDGVALAESGCLKAVGHFLGVANTADWYNPTVGYLTDGFTQQQWEVGDRTVRCFAYAYTKNRTFVGSVRGIGTAQARSN
jgi:hypothetical protein